ncbi:hypothetical protein L2K70_04360 [Nocardioides KLBMP 9356]|uniref:Lipoprotein n=1 Tax=Nocardioides potassii TaxID=2911371 RepID=A0ABS9H8Q1_9ACTN|nr:hypothetical protein [Nocardioides potassii]MCF6376829.1 hypothetical protein [Nocardioides potassii]
MTRRMNAAPAAALAAGALLALTGCGGSGAAAEGETKGPELLGEKLSTMVGTVDKMGIVEWHGQMLTKSPEKGGKRVLDLDARYSPSLGYSEISMDTVLDGNAQQIDYLVVNDRVYFNSEKWGPVANDCWADITDDAARTWALPRDLDPSWALTQGRAVSADGEDVTVALGYKDVIAGLPMGLFESVPSLPYDTEATATIEPHGHLIEVGIDVAGMWKKVAPAERATLDKRVGYWAMTMKESPDGSAIKPPGHVFDPTVTPPSQCKR